MTGHETDYASYQLLYEADYVSYQLTYELEAPMTEYYEQLELRQDSEITRFVSTDAGFSTEEEAFFSSEINPVLVLEDYETRLDRLQFALSSVWERATRLATQPARLQPNPH